jgi:ATP-binding cassette subfamily B protein
VNLLILFILVSIQMFLTNPELTLYVLIPLPLMSVLIYFVSNIMNKRSQRVQEQQSFLSTIVQESFSGIRVIKAHIREHDAEKRFAVEADEYKKRSMRLTLIDSFFMPTILLLIGVSTILTVYIGSIQSLNGNINPGEIVEFLFYANMLTWPFASVGWVTAIIQRAAASQTRINEFMKVKTDIDPDAGTDVKFENEIVFNNVGITYENSGVTALKNVNLRIRKGETIGIIGRTGSGKSSIASLLLRQIDPTSGSIEIDGTDLRNKKLSSWRTAIGYVPQDHFLFSDSIRNNILFGVDASKTSVEELEAAAKDACIHETVMKFPDKYDTLLGERGINLSGGQKQRVSIARALVKKPEILILDDCLSAVDNETEEHILRAIRSELDKKTAVIVSHRISSIKYANRIIVMEGGMIAEEGTHENLLLKKGAYYKIFRKQELMEDMHIDDITGEIVSPVNNSQ